MLPIFHSIKMKIHDLNIDTVPLHGNQIEKTRTIIQNENKYYITVNHWTSSEHTQGVACYTLNKNKTLQIGRKTILASVST
jgi:hypothetical protein